MEQNLSDRERRRRLAMGVACGAGAAGLYVYHGWSVGVAALGALALGLAANYVTCFCGTKRAVRAVRDRLRG